MPAEGIHLTALREATAAPALDAPVRRHLVRRDDAARLGAIAPDLPYFHRYAVEVARYVAGLPARPSPWGAAIHEGGAVALLGSLLALARRERAAECGAELAAIALGVASHCAMDRALHPLINALARLHRGGANHDASHREVEKFQSICFHEQYLGRDTMGTPAITGYLTIHVAGRLGGRLGGRLTAAPDDRLGRLLGEAWAAALGRAPAAGELAGFARGYRRHAGLLGTPLGKRIAPPAAKDAARPRYLRGAWGAFDALLEDAIAASVPILNAAGAVLDAADRDAPAAQAALARLLPAGTIDPQGAALDLGRPVAISLAAA